MTETGQNREGYLAALIGLGVAIDYSLLLITRWREELAAGHPGQEAVSRAMATAGRSVAFSGITVAIGLLSLIVLPVPALRSIGIGGMIVPAVSVAVTLTLLPVLLATVAQRMDWPHRNRPATSRTWTRPEQRRNPREWVERAGWPDTSGRRRPRRPRRRVARRTARHRADPDLGGDARAGRRLGARRKGWRPPSRGRRCLGRSGVRPRGGLHAPRWLGRAFAGS